MTTSAILIMIQYFTYYAAAVAEELGHPKPPKPQVMGKLAELSI